MQPDTSENAMLTTYEAIFVTAKGMPPKPHQLMPQNQYTAFLIAVSISAPK